MNLDINRAVCCGALMWGLMVRQRQRARAAIDGSPFESLRRECGPVLKLRMMGFCGADDSVDVRLLGAVSARFPWVEWGVLFREDKQGMPRFASYDWLEELRREQRSRARAVDVAPMRLAAHLCSSYVRQVLAGDAAFVRWLYEHIGFQRVQVNATAANGVDTRPEVLGGGEALRGLLQTMKAVPEVEFILQRNEETRPLWQALEHLPEHEMPQNLSFLHDESKGLGTLADSWPEFDGQAPIGYAGGLGPGNILTQLRKMVSPARGKPIWVDMESSLRTMTRGAKEPADGALVDVFDINKVMLCVRAALRLGLKLDNK